MVARVADVEQGEEVRRLAGAGEHRGRAAFELADLGCDRVVGRVLQTGVEVAGFGQSNSRLICSLDVYLNVVAWMIGGVRDSPLPGWYPPWTQVVSMCVIVLSFALETAWRAWDACVMLT